MVSADVPVGAVQRVMKSIGTDEGALGACSSLSMPVPDGQVHELAVDKGVVLIEPPSRQLLPGTIRHVVLPPESPLVPLLEELVARKESACDIGTAGFDDDTGSSLTEDGTDSEAGGIAEMAPQGLKRMSAARVLVFVESSERAEQLRRAMRNRRLAALTVHSADGGPHKQEQERSRVSGERISVDGRRSRYDVLQEKRSKHRGRARSFKLFAEGRVRLLIGTDMLAYGMMAHAASQLDAEAFAYQLRSTRELTRVCDAWRNGAGVDIQGASHVLNTNVPTSSSTYLHRAGRVGRVGGTEGTVISIPRNEQVQKSAPCRDCTSDMMSSQKTLYVGVRRSCRGCVSLQAFWVSIYKRP